MRGSKRGRWSQDARISYGCVTHRTVTYSLPANLGLATLGLVAGDWLEIEVPVELNDWAGWDYLDTLSVGRFGEPKVQSRRSIATSHSRLEVMVASWMRPTMHSPSKSVKSCRPSSGPRPQRWLQDELGSKTPSRPKMMKSNVTEVTTTQRGQAISNLSLGFSNTQSSSPPRSD